MNEETACKIIGTLQMESSASRCVLWIRRQGANEEKLVA